MYFYFVYASVGLDVILAPSLTVYYDVDAVSGDGYYASFSIGHDFDLGFATLSIGTAVGYASEDFVDYYYNDSNTADDGFTDIASTISLGFDVTENFSISPFITHSILVDAGDDAAGDDNEEVFGGVFASYSF